MTTEAAAAQYLAQHQHEMRDKSYAIYNPHNKPLEDIPFIYGFNNGGRDGWWQAVALSQDGINLGGHTCSDEAYMLNDLGILEGTRPERHDDSYKKHYPDGYRMAFVRYKDVESNEGLMAAIKLTEDGKPAADDAGKVGE